MQATCGLTQASWNCLLSVAVKQGQPYKALLLFRQMKQEGVPADSKAFVLAIQACCSITDSVDVDMLSPDRFFCTVDPSQVGMALHSDARREGLSSHTFVGSALVNLYGKCGHVAGAVNAFTQMKTHDVVSWTTMLAVYVEHSHVQTAFHTFGLMLENGVAPNGWTFSIMIQVCCTFAEQEEFSFPHRIPARVLSLEITRALHEDALRSGYTDIYVSSTLVTTYATCGDLVEAEHVFYKMYGRDVVSWNAMLSAYLEQEEAEKALLLYCRMQKEASVKPNNLTLVAACQACCMLAEKEHVEFSDGLEVERTPLKIGKAIHVDAQLYGLASHTFVGSALVTMYSKCGSISEAEMVFHGLLSSNTTTWNAMLSAYIDRGQLEKALLLYERMLNNGVSMDAITFKCILSVCSGTGCVEICRQIHCTFVSRSNSDTPLVTTLIHAYGNCASMRDANTTFSALHHSDIVSWNALCAGHAREGSFLSNLQTYEEMQQADIEPDDVSFLTLMSACNHAGLVTVGLMYWLQALGKLSNPKHFASVVDLFGRAGNFVWIDTMCRKWQEQLDVAALICLLKACQTHGNVPLGKWAFDQVTQLQCQDASAYVLMYNTYADTAFWVEA